MAPFSIILVGEFCVTIYKMGYNLKKCLSGYLRGIFSGDGRT